MLYQILQRLRTRLRESRPSRRRPQPQCRPQLQLLETRLLLTTANVLSEPTFRTDEFNYAANFDFDLVAPKDFRDKIEGGQQSSTSASLKWHDPVNASGFIAAEAVGTGTAEFYWLDPTAGNDPSYTGWLPCADYRIYNAGTYSFDVNAESETVTVTDKEALVSRYDAYQSHAIGCEQPTPATSYSFGGSLDGYSGTYDPQTLEVNIGYDRFHGPTHVVVTTDVISSGPVNTDPSTFTMTLNPYGSEEPRGVPGVDFLDLNNAGIDLTVDLAGKAIPPVNGDVWEPVAKVRLFWADSDMNKLEGGEVQMDNRENLNVYWNNTQIHVEVDDLSDSPHEAEFLIVELDVADTVDIANQKLAVPIVCNDESPFILELQTEEFVRTDDMSGSIVCKGEGTVYVGRNDGIDRMLRIEDATVITGRA